MVFFWVYATKIAKSKNIYKPMRNTSMAIFAIEFKKDYIVIGTYTYIYIDITI
jgi:hypothetical protein